MRCKHQERGCSGGAFELRICLMHIRRPADDAASAAYERRGDGGPRVPRRPTERLGEIAASRQSASCSTRGSASEERRTQVELLRASASCSRWPAAAGRLVAQVHVGAITGREVSNGLRQLARAGAVQGSSVLRVHDVAATWMH